MLTTELVSREYSAYSFEELVEEKNELIRKIHEEFINSNGFDSCFHSLSASLSAPQQSITIKTIQNLSNVLEELDKRRRENGSRCLGISYNTYLIGLKGLLHFFYLSTITLDFSSIFLDCKKSEYVQISSVACAITAVALGILNEWGENKIAQKRQILAQLENCTVDELPGVKQLYAFLNSFIELVLFLEKEKEDKDGLSSSNSSNDSGIQINSVVLLGLKSNKRELVRICISQLRAVPDFILEKYAGANALLIRKSWIQEIEKMAKIHYKPSKPAKGLDFSSSFGEKNDSIKIDIFELKRDSDLHKITLSALIKLYEDEIVKFNNGFKLDVYLSYFTFDQNAIVNFKEIQEQKQMVETFIVRLKNLQDEIHTRENRHRRANRILCLSTDRKQDVLYGAKHISTVIFFGSTSLSSVTNCRKGFGFQEVGKIIGMVSGLFSMALEGVCSWTSSRELNNKLERASLINVDLLDLDGFDQFHNFVDSFLLYVEEIGAPKLLLENLLDPDWEGLPNPHEIMQKIKKSLEQCERNLESIDNKFLEKLIKRNGAIIKKEWQNSLRAIFEKLSTRIRSASQPQNNLAQSKVQPGNESNNTDLKEEKKEEDEDIFEMHEPKNLGTKFVYEGHSVVFLEKKSERKEFEEEDWIYDDECILKPNFEEPPPSKKRNICIVQ